MSANITIPNTLTIFINTRIRGYPKIKYSPSMTVPRTKSETVYFDPLVKLNSSVINYIPSGHPPSEKFTQFFNKNEFSGLINRVISSTHQKTIGLVEATNSGYVDNNIELILNTLFAKNGQFYIRDQPFTIYSKTWNEGDWRIDTKKFESKLSYSPYGYSSYGMRMSSVIPQNDAESQLVAFKKNYPSNVLNGYSTGEKYSNFEDNSGYRPTDEARGISGTGTGISNIPNPVELNKSQEIQQNKYLNYLNKNIPNNFQSLIGRDIVEQNAINLNTNIRNIPSDPISLSILYSIQQNYSDDIQLNPTVLQPLYNVLINSGNAYNEANNNFTKVLGTQLPTITVPNFSPGSTIAKGGAKGGAKGDLADINLDNVKNTMEQKQQYNDISQRLYKLMQQYKNTNYTIDRIMVTPNLKEELMGAVSTLIEYKKQFIKLVLITMKLLLDKIEKMQDYIKNLIYFFEGLMKVKIDNLIKQGLTPEQVSFQSYLIQTLFDFDIKCYQDLLQNPNVLTYIKNLKILIQNEGIKIDKNIFIQYNFKEELTNYYNYPQLLLIQKTEYDIYLFKIMELNEEYESHVWESITTSSVTFLDFIKKTTSQKINDAQVIMINYRNTYTQPQIDAMKMIISEKDKNIPLQKQTPLFYESFQTKLVKKMTTEFLNIQDEIILAYDLITLYSRISVIVFAREIAYLTSQKNVNKIRIQEFGDHGFKNYYAVIYSDVSIIPILKQSPPLFWSIADYSDTTIQPIIVTNNNMLSDEEAKQPQLNHENFKLNEKYTAGMDLLIPQISALGMQQQCLKITTTDQSPKTPKTNDQRKNNYEAFMDSKYDDEATNKFRLELVNIYSTGMNDKMLEQITEDGIDNIIEEWNLYGDTSPYNSLFTCIAIALNTGLIGANSTTNNPYSENGLYSTASLRNAVADNITTPEIHSLLRGGESVINYDANDPERIQYNFLFNESNNFIGYDPNSKELVRAAIRLDPNQGGKYYGNYNTIGILETVFKVKFITLKRRIFQLNDELLPNGVLVYFNSPGNPLNYGTIVSRTKIRGTRNNQYSYDILLDDHTIVQNIMKGQIDKIDNPNYVVDCSDSQQNLDSANEFTHYAILIEDESEINYYVAFNSKIKNCIFIAKPPIDTIGVSGAAQPLNELPLYIYYIIFKNCFRSRILVPKNNDFVGDILENWYSLNRPFEAMISVLYTKFNNMITKKQQRAALRNQKGGSSIQRGGSILNVPNKNLYMDINNMGINNMGILNSDYGDSKLSYYVVIDLELYPGNSIPIGEKAVLGCQTRYEKIRQAYAQLFGIRYQPNEFLRSGFVAPNANSKQKNKK